MADAEWATLYTRIRADTLERIKAAAAADDRTVAKWVEIHFRNFFETEYSCLSASPLSTSHPSSPSEPLSPPEE